MHNRGPIWFGVALVVIVAAIGVWIYFISPPQGLNVGIQLSTTPANTAIGDPFDLSAALTNDSGQAMENAAVSIVLPSGLVSVDSPNQRVVTQTLGSVGAGSVSHQDFHIVATNGQNALAHVTAKVTYTVTGSSAQFESDQSIDIPVGQPAVNVSITAPQSVFSGQNFPTTLTSAIPA